MNPKFPNGVYSVDQILAISEELHAYANELAAQRHGSPAGGPISLSPRAEAVLELLPQDKRDDASVEQWRMELEKLANTAPTVTLVLAAAATPGLKQELVGWLRENVHPYLLVNFRVNPDIVGGIVIRSVNHVYDCSFRKALLAHPENFTRLLVHV